MGRFLELMSQIRTAELRARAQARGLVCSSSSCPSLYSRVSVPEIIEKQAPRFISGEGMSRRVRE